MKYSDFLHLFHSITSQLATTHDKGAKWKLINARVEELFNSEKVIYIVRAFIRANPANKQWVSKQQISLKDNFIGPATRDVFGDLWQLVQKIITDGTRQLSIEKQLRQGQFPILTTTLSTLPTPDNYFSKPLQEYYCLNSDIVIEYLDLLDAGITHYFKTFCPLSDRMSSIVKKAGDGIGKFKGQFCQVLDESADFNIMLLSSKIPGGDWGSVGDLCTNFRGRFQSTQNRLKSVQCWDPVVQSATPETTCQLTRTIVIEEVNGLKDHLFVQQGGARETQKWFAIYKKGTTGVTHSHLAMITLKKGALAVIQQCYNQGGTKSEAAVWYKGGGVDQDETAELDCFGIHDDVLYLFNRMIVKIEIYKVDDLSKIVKTITVVGWAGNKPDDKVNANIK
jgi:hypothetical protein